MSVLAHLAKPSKWFVRNKVSNRTKSLQAVLRGGEGVAISSASKTRVDEHSVEFIRWRLALDKLERYYNNIPDARLRKIERSCGRMSGHCIEFSLSRNTESDGFK